MKFQVLSKKFLAVVLTLAIIGSIGVVTLVNADASKSAALQFTVSSVKGNPGDTINVNVNMGAVVDLVSGELQLHYDSTVLQFVSIDNSQQILPTASVVHKEKDTNNDEHVYLYYDYVDATTKTGYTGEGGTVINATFKIKETASTGSYPFRLVAEAFMDKNTVQFTPVVNHGSVTVVKALESIAVAPKTATIGVGDTQQKTVSAQPQDAETGVVTWSSSKPEVAAVDNNGVVTGKANGTATITATTEDGKKDTAEITVAVPVAAISLDQTSLNFHRGDAAKTIAVTIQPSNASDKTVTWESSNDAVATVKNGLVTPKGKGSAVITATSSNGKTATCTVTVDVPLTGIALDKSQLALKKGQTGTLTVLYTPDDADNKDVTWTSSDTTVATVSNGTVTALKAGTAVIKASAPGVADAACTVTVTEIQIHEISFNKATATIQKGENETLTVNYPDETTDSKAVSWSSSDASIASVDQNGKVTAHKANAGKAVITATVVDRPAVKATCEVTVSSTLKSIALDQSTLNLDKGSAQNLTVVYTPADTTSDKTMIWTSSNNSVVTVADGVVTAVGAGTAIITATSKLNSSIKATCEVSVSVPLVSISVNAQKTTLLKGETTTASVGYNPTDTTVSKDITWSSDKKSIASVDANGTITAKSEGTANITAEVAGKTSVVTITVTEIHLTGIKISSSTAALVKGDAKDLSVTYAPANTTDEKSVTWISSNEKAAVVDANGKVTAVGAGTATITATAQANSTLKATCDVTVTVPLDSISLNQSKLFLIKDKTSALEVLFNPEDTTDSKDVIWSSSDKTVATVSDSGLVTAMKEGTAIITAAVGDKTAVCEVKVLEATDQIVAKDIINKIKTAEDDIVTINLTKSGIVTKDILEAAIKENKQVVFHIIDETTGNTRYSWSFDGTKMTGNQSDVDLTITLNADNKTISDQVSSEVNPFILSFAQKGSLPGGVTVSVNVGEKYGDGQNIWFYAYSQKNDEFELIKKDLTVTNGIVVLPVTVGADYVLTTGEIVEPSDPEEPDNGSQGNQGSNSQDTSSSTNSGSQSTNNKPKTGDSSGFAVAVALMAGALGAGVVVLKKRKED